MVDKHIDVDRYKIKQNETVNLHNIPTFCDIAIEKSEVKQELFPTVIHEMKSWQEKLYAEKKYGLTFVLQAMDAAGKDSTINHVFSELNPSGLFVKSFKEPTSLESSHDYLWRIHKALPARGEIVIFNRSQYEEVIVTRVHQLLEKESFPTSLITNHIWEERYEQIMHWEKYLAQNGFPMIKIFLHVSKKEQEKRLIDRISRPEKNWKLAFSDISERKYWNKYQEYYEELLSKTSTSYAPWYIVPADDKWYTRYVVACIVVKELRKLNPSFPTLDSHVEEQLKQLKTLLEQGQIYKVMED